MKLVQLEPQFVQYFEDETGSFLRYVPDLAQAQGVVFLCPSCFERNKGAIGTHRLEVSFSNKGVKDHQGSHNDEGKPSRWDATGTSYSDLTTNPSILIHPAKPACDGWHGYIKNGEIS